jgi:hypothetical protein
MLSSCQSRATFLMDLLSRHQFINGIGKMSGGNITMTNGLEKIVNLFMFETTRNFF